MGSPTRVLGRAASAADRKTVVLRSVWNLLPNEKNAPKSSQTILARGFGDVEEDIGQSK